MVNLQATLNQLVEGGLYYCAGILFLLLGRIVWNLITRYNANKEIGENDNHAAGVAEFGFLIALALIILASVKGERAPDVSIWQDLLNSFLYTVFGFIALTLGKVILNVFTPFDLDKEIARDRNVAAGWLQAGFSIAIALILYGVL